MLMAKLNRNLLFLTFLSDGLFSLILTDKTGNNVIQLQKLSLKSTLPVFKPFLYIRNSQKVSLGSLIDKDCSSFMIVRPPVKSHDQNRIT